MISYLYDEAGADTIEEIMNSGEEVLAPFMAIMEVHYKLLRDFGSDGARDFLDTLYGWPMRVVESTPEWGQVAAELKVPGKISLGDVWVAALALMEDAAVVHKDPEFETVPQLKMLTLPYRPRGNRS
jgi:predicted nucleic acid-binding protein